MSLIITSNTSVRKEGGEIDLGGINKPASYVNHLQGTLTIPERSQIAVQSIKINKSGNVTLGKGNNNMGFYFGRSFDTDTQSDFNDMPTWMATGSIGKDNDVVGVNEFAK